MGLKMSAWDDLDVDGKVVPLPARPDTLWSITEPWDEAAIPQRPWIARGYLLRGSVTVISGPGSAGKSSLMVGWSTSLSTGFEFGRFRPAHPFRVMTYNVEDDREEQQRRYSAQFRAMKVADADWAGRMEIIGPDAVGTLLVRDPIEGVLINTGVMEKIDARIKRFRPDVLMLDPFVELHDSEENDNTAVRAVLAHFRAMSKEYGCATAIMLHSRKGASTPGDPDSLRGASAIVGAARVALTLNVMSEDEAETFAIPRDERRNYFRLDGAKSNYAPIEEAEWFQRKEFQLSNGISSDADWVAAAMPWSPPSIWTGMTPDAKAAALDRIEAGPAPGVLYAPSNRGANNGRWVGVVIMQTMRLEEKQAALVVKRWLQDGVLVEDTYRDPVSRKPRAGVKVDRDKKP